MTTTDRHTTTNRRATPDRRGIALALALFALATLGALTATAVMLAQAETRSAAIAEHEQHALAAAESGALLTATEWRTIGLDTLPAGATRHLEPTPLGAASYRATVSRLNEELYLVRSEGTHATPGTDPASANHALLATRRVGTLLRRHTPAIHPHAAVTALGTITIGAETRITAGPPADPSCTDSTQAASAGILTPATTQLSTTHADCANLTCITGAPPVITDATLTDSALQHLGDYTFDQLAAEADLTPTGTTSAAAIAAPLTYSPGNLHLAGGHGQGLLLVRGNLDLTAATSFTGLALVLGSVQTPPGTSNATLHGALLTAGNATLHGTTITYSACAIRNAVHAAARIHPLRKRKWLQLF